MWAPSHMNKIFFEQMLIHQSKLFQALVSSTNRREIKSWPEVMGSDLILGEVTLKKSEAITRTLHKCYNTKKGIHGYGSFVG